MSKSITLINLMFAMFVVSLSKHHKILEVTPDECMDLNPELPLIVNSVRLRTQTRKNLINILMSIIKG